jgi:hypothetical protein
MRVATRTISGLHDGASTEELDELSIRTAAALISEEPNYSKLASRMLSTVIDKEVQNRTSTRSASRSRSVQPRASSGETTARDGHHPQPQAERRHRTRAQLAL